MTFKLTYRDTKSKALRRIDFDGDTFDPETVFSFTTFRSYSFLPQYDSLLYVDDNGPLELVKPVAATNFTLSVAPANGHVGSVTVAPGGQLAVFHSQLLGQHKELFVSDLKAPSGNNAKRISQYLTNSGTRRDVTAFQPLRRWQRARVPAELRRKQPAPAPLPGHVCRRAGQGG